jgi:hypothetical protein
MLRQTLLAFALLSCSSFNAWSAESAGAVKTLWGAVAVSRSSSAPVPITVGERVFPGDRLITGADGYIGITLHDDTRITLGPKSEFLIKEFEFNASSYVGGLSMSFLKGTAAVVTGLLGKHSRDRVSFNTPTSTIGIRGTEFVVDLEESEAP